jgi:hypothetical protein
VIIVQVTASARETHGILLPLLRRIVPDPG